MRHHNLSHPLAENFAVAYSFPKGLFLDIINYEMLKFN